MSGTDTDLKNLTTSLRNLVRRGYKAGERVCDSILYQPVDDRKRRAVRVQHALDGLDSFENAKHLPRVLDAMCIAARLMDDKVTPVIALDDSEQDVFSALHRFQAFLGNRTRLHKMRKSDADDVKDVVKEEIRGIIADALAKDDEEVFALFVDNSHAETKAWLQALYEIAADNKSQRVFIVYLGGKHVDL